MCIICTELDSILEPSIKEELLLALCFLASQRDCHELVAQTASALEQVTLF